MQKPSYGARGAKIQRVESKCSGTCSSQVAMGVGSQFRVMSNVQLGGGLRSVAPRISGRSLSSVSVTRPLGLPLHAAKHVAAHRGRLQLRTRAVVSAPEKVDTGSVPPFQAWTTGAAIKKREDIKSIMILGAGPIVIGQVLLSRSCND